MRKLQRTWRNCGRKIIIPVVVVCKSRSQPCSNLGHIVLTQGRTHECSGEGKGLGMVVLAIQFFVGVAYHRAQAFGMPLRLVFALPGSTVPWRACHR